MTVYLNGVAQVVAHEATHVSGGVDDIDSALVIAAMAGLTSTKIWQGNVGNRPVEIDVPAGAVMATGTYTGDNTANRAIPHGLGVTPNLVLIIEDGAGKSACFIIIRVAMIMEIAGGGSEVVTIPNATNFYVGNAVSYTRTANDNTENYRWFAIG